MDATANTSGTAAAESPASGSDTSAGPGEDRHRVAAIQQMLDYLGYFPGAVNGIATADTQRALREFQRQHGLPETGNVDGPVLRFFRHVRVPDGTLHTPPIVVSENPPAAAVQEQSDAGANELVFTAGLEAHDKGDHKTARQHWLIAAEGGHREAQYRLGVMFDHGEGVVADAVSAAFWYGRAAESGHVRAQTNIGVMYRQGDGVAKDSRTALAWTERAARQGVARAQTNLALMLAGGEGTNVDYVQAYMWFATAAAQGNADARKGMNALQSLMTFSQLTDAKSRAKNFVPQLEGPE